MMDGRKVNYTHSLSLQELAREKLESQYGLNLWQFNHKGNCWHEDPQKGISSLGEPSFPLALEVEKS